MKGAVATGHPEVTEAAVEVLKAGGNAFDAVVAAGFASAVAEPALTSLGGGGFLLARTAEGRSTLFDFFVDTAGRGINTGSLEPHFLPITVHFPGSDQIFNIGLGSAAVPGTLRGYLHVHGRLGCLPLREVIAPAVKLAREGLTVNSKQAYFLDLLRPIMTHSASGRALFQPGGQCLRAGDRYKNPELAAFLVALAKDGDQEFYRGAIARRIAQDMRAGQGLITETDLAAYRVVERQPLLTDYRGFHLLTNPPPSLGGSLLALSLQLLGECKLSQLHRQSPEYAVSLIAVMAEVDHWRAGGFTGFGKLEETSFSDSLERIRIATGGTTHISVSDVEGNAASMTTSNGEGSGYIVPGTGIMLNNMLGEDDLHPQGFHATPSGLRVASMMAPSLLLDRGELGLVLGSGGSKRIRTAMLQVISNVVDFGMSVKDAVEAPRLHWDGHSVQVEPGFSEAALAVLGQRWAVNRWSVRDVYFGGVNVIDLQGKGFGDPRRGGNARVLD